MKWKNFVSFFFALIFIVCGTGAVFAEKQKMIYAYVNEDVITIKLSENLSALEFMDLLRSGDGRS